LHAVPGQIETEAAMANFPEAGTPDLDQLREARIVDAAGQAASLVSVARQDDETRVCIGLGNGMQVLVPFGLLAPEEGGYRLPFAFEGRQEERPRMRVPVVEETLQVGKRTVDTGRGVRLHKTVAEQLETIEQTLLSDELTIERVPAGQAVAADAPPQARYEGDTLIVPVLEEVLVVQKQLRLREEVRITRHREPRQVRQTLPLRSEQVEVERFDESEQERGDERGNEAGKQA